MDETDKDDLISIIEDDGIDEDIPTVLPLMPVRDVVIYTDMLMPLFVGRDKSIRALDAAKLHAELLDDLDRRAIPWGIVTNKPAWLTDPLMQAMRFNERTRCIVSGDTCQYSKPHPQPMLHAACLIEAAPEHCLYLGDARRDIQAGKAAGMMTAAAAYGYIEPHDPAENWDADWLIAHPLELLPLLQSAA